MRLFYSPWFWIAVVALLALCALGAHQLASHSRWINAPAG